MNVRHQSLNVDTWKFKNIFIDIEINLEVSIELDSFLISKPFHQGQWFFCNQMPVTVLVNLFVLSYTRVKLNLKATERRNSEKRFANQSNIFYLISQTLFNIQFFRILYSNYWNIFFVFCKAFFGEGGQYLWIYQLSYKCCLTGSIFRCFEPRSLKSDG